MPSHKHDFRIDFEFTPVEMDEKTRMVTFAVKPNPERYEIIEKNGEKIYHDKFDNNYYPEKFLNKLHENTTGLPIYYSPSKIDDADSYILERIEDTNDFFDKKENLLSDSKEELEEFLVDLENEKLNFVVLSIDLKDSTKMSQELSVELNAQIISLFISEMTLIITKFNGFRLKPVGDGLIAYFPEPNTIGKVDNALNCADMMRNVIIHVINPLLNDNGLRSLYFKIGIDFGEAIVKNMGINGINGVNDLIGETVNIASKILKLGDSNQILVGNSVVLKAHTFWRQRLIRFKTSKTWKYKDKSTGRPYKVYTLNDI